MAGLIHDTRRIHDTIMFRGDTVFNTVYAVQKPGRTNKIFKAQVTEKSTWWLLIAWHPFGVRPSGMIFLIICVVG